MLWALLITASLNVVADVAPYVGPWGVRAGECTNYSAPNQAAKNCVHYDGGTWSSPNCLNPAHPTPWSVDDFIEPTVASYSGESATFHGWVMSGPTTCIGFYDTVSPGYTLGILSRNVGLLTVDGEYGDFGARRDRTVACPIGSTASSNQCNRGNHADPYKTYPDCKKEARCSESGYDRLSALDNGTNPVNVLTGEKIHEELDYRGTGPNPLRFRRYYSTRSDWRFAKWEASGFGEYWRHTYSRHVNYFDNGTYERATVVRENGNRYYFSQLDPLGGDNWVAVDGDVTDLLSVTGTGSNKRWIYRNGEGVEERYDFETGRLLELVSPQGHVTTLTYSAVGRLDEVNDGFGHALKFAYNGHVTEPDVISSITVYKDGVAIPGSTIRYEYKTPLGQALLVGRVFYPDETPSNPADNPMKEYLYNEGVHLYQNYQADIWAGPSGSQFSFAHAMTGIMDENGARYATYKYKRYLFDGGVYRRMPAGGGHGAAGIDGKLANQYTITRYHPRSHYTNADSHTGYASIRDALDVERNFHFQLRQKILKPTQIAGTGCATCGTNTAQVTYAAATGLATSQTDFMGNKSVYAYDDDGLETCRIEGVAPANPTTNAPRRVVTAWDGTFRVPTEVRVYEVSGSPDLAVCSAADDTGWSLRRKTTTTYEADSARIATRTERSYQGTTEDEAPRTTTYAYYGSGDTNGNEYQLKTIDGPLSGSVDVTTYKYATVTGANLVKGGLVQVIDALGHTTSVTAHDAYGRPTTIVDPNGVTTTLVYHPRGWLRARTVDGQTTTFAYDDVGQLEQVTLPDGAWIGYAYDAAHRLTDITDNAGNRIHYTLDALGNRVQEDTCNGASCTAGNTTRSLQRMYNSLNRLEKLLTGDGYAEVTGYQHDANGRLTRVIDPRDPGMSAVGGLPANPTIATNYLYDALNRMRETIDALGGDTQVAHAVTDEPTSVDDPRGLVTSYTRNGFGEARVQQSPDTGQTTYTYDTAGKVLTQVDARSVQTQYVYDALHRVTAIVYGSGHPQNVAYTYDETGSIAGCSGARNGIGRLTSVTDESGSTQYAYDGRGNVTCKAVTITGNDWGQSTVWRTHYAYDGADRLTEMTYPSGTVVRYLRNSAGRVSEVTAAPDGVTHQTVVSNVAYAPFGPVTAWTYRNGADTAVRELDRAYRVKALQYQESPTTVHKDWLLGRDKAGNVVSWDHALEPWWSSTYAYDGNARLDLETYDTWLSVDYTYDANGNRTAGGFWGGTTYDYDWSPGAASNRLRTETVSGQPARVYGYDAAGNVQTVDGSTYTHGANGRLSTACLENWHALNCNTYLVLRHNAQGLVALEDWDGEQYGWLWPSRFHYDEGGFLLAEENPQWYASPVDYIYLEETLVGVVAPGTHGSRQVHWVMTDHLGTPLAAMSAGGGYEYEVMYGAFGELAYYAYPGVEIRLARPGQIRSANDEIYYNGYRDYEPYLGRYLQSDPIGLEGGITTYAYAGNNPLKYIDPDGRLFLLPIISGLVEGGVSAEAAVALISGIALIGGSAAINSAQNNVIAFPPDAIGDNAGPSSGVPSNDISRLPQICKLIKETPGNDILSGICLYQCPDGTRKFLEKNLDCGEDCPGAIPNSRGKP